MDTAFLQQIGLNKTQAVAYKLLIENGSLTPPELSDKSGEGRTNSYKVLDQLVNLGLAEKSPNTKKLSYLATNPTNLERFIEKKRKSILQVEQQVKAQMPQLLNYFYTFNSQPGVRFYQGKEALITMYEDQLRTKQDVYFVRTMADDKFLGETLYKYMEKRAKLGITAHGLAPATQGTLEYAKQNDERLKRQMSWLPPDSYDAPVEIDIYGDKVAFISFGEEAIGTIVESPQIAQAMRQAFELMKLGAKSLLPSENAKNDEPSEVE